MFAGTCSCWRAMAPWRRRPACRHLFASTLAASYFRTRDLIYALKQQESSGRATLGLASQTPAPELSIVSAAPARQAAVRCGRRR